METAKNLVNAASNMVFGESQTQNQTAGEEPLSGQQGKGTASEPYDAGNASGMPFTYPTIQAFAVTVLANAFSGEPTNKETSATETTGTESTNTATTNEPSQDPDDISSKPVTGPTGTDVGAAAPESGTKPTIKQQGADRPNDAPEGEQADAVANKKADAEDAMDRDTDAADSGSAPNDDAGPKPLGSDGASGSSNQGGKESLGSTSTEKGTGEKYVKSSGTKADGGDFDATNPGAGREAERTFYLFSHFLLYTHLSIAVVP
jgi:hypothetical protein